jgi:RimJ/RimL family protein N-acetyltransferase
VRSLADAHEYLVNGPIASYTRHGFGLYLVELAATDEPIGICGILQREALPDPDLGFAFLPAYWGQGFAFEAAAAVRSYARSQLGVGRLLAITSPRNDASIRLLERLGFRFERMTRLENDGTELKVFAEEDP